jgi:lipopolysaccharide export LptBFGC system permease protein LptF
MDQKYAADPADGSSAGELLNKIQESVSLKVAVSGILSVFAGYIVQFVDISWTDTGVWSAVFAVWGAALLILGITAYAFVWWSYR